MKREMETNAAVEIHDSKLVRVESRGPDVLAFLHAYVHRSAGRPGVDAGTGWMQPVQLRFTKAAALGSMGAIPMELLDGRLDLSGKKFENCFPMPLSHVGPSRIELESWNDATIVIEGAGLTAAFTGPAEYVEEFKP